MIKLGRSFWWILGLISLSFLISRLPELSKNLIYSRLTLTLLVILVFNALWAGFSQLGIGFNRTTRNKRKQVGEILTERYEVENRSFILKVWLKIVDQAQIGRGSGSRVLTWLGGGQSRVYIAYTFLQKRGWFYLGPTQIESGDIFGLFRIKREFKSPSRLLVVPYTVDIEEFPAPFGLLSGGRALRQKTVEVTPYAAGVREYVPGDPLKRIHWPTSARKGKIFVKEFERDPLAEVWIFIDAKADVHYRNDEEKPQTLSDLWWVKEKREFSLPSSSEEYAVSIAASLSKYYIRQKREVGLAAAGQNYMVLPAERGERQLGKILEALAVLRAEGEMPFWGLVGSQFAHLGRGSIVVLISPSSDENILTMVIEILQRGLIPVVILIDQASFGGPKSSAQFNQRLDGLGVSSAVVHNGDDLAQELGRVSSNLRGKRM